MAATQIPVEATVKTRTAGIRLRPDAAASFDHVSDEVFAKHRWRVVPTDGHRSQALQEKIFLERYEPRTSGTGPFGDVRTWNGKRYVRMRGAAAAVPGTSNHGGGIAVDAGAGVNTYGTRWTQFANVARSYGWTHTEGASVNEPWHWVFGGTGSITIGKDNVMTPEQESRIFAELAAIKETAIEAREIARVARNYAESAMRGIWYGGQAEIDGHVQVYRYGVLPVVTHSQNIAAQGVSVAKSNAEALKPETPKE